MCFALLFVALVVDRQLFCGGLSHFLSRYLFRLFIQLNSWRCAVCVTEAEQPSARIDIYAEQGH
jgi:hypothetical protein